MAEAWIRFNLCLNDFLPAHLRGRPFTVPFRPGDTVKNVIEARGVPHTEVHRVAVNDAVVPLSYQLRPGDQISVHPVPPRVEAEAQDPRFLLDVHLGRLARDLRALGHDAAWGPPFDDEALARRAALEGRILLTRDRALLMRRTVTAGYLVRSRLVVEQLPEVIRRFGLQGRSRPFTRCLSCNSVLEELPAPEARPLVPEVISSLYDTFRRCPCCRKVYWKGTHWEDMVRRLGPLLEQPR